MKVILVPIAVILLAIIIAVTSLTNIFGGFITAIFHPVEFSPVGVDLAAGESLSQDITAEGMVLLRNEDINGVPALPMPILEANRMPTSATVDLPQEEIMQNWTPTPISVFGWGATDSGVILGGSGSGDAMAHADPADVISIRRALTYNGFEYYAPLMNMMEGLVPVGRQSAALHSMVEAYPFYGSFWSFYEPTMAQYESYMARAVAHSDTAMIVLSRRAGEGADLLHSQVVWNNSGSPVRPPMGPGAPIGPIRDVPTTYTHVTNRTYLDLTEREEELIRAVAAQPGFTRVIVMLNVANAINTSFLDEIPGIHAAFVMGFTGMTGGHTIAAMLSGYRTIRGNAILRDSYGEPLLDANGNVQFIPTGDYLMDGDDYIYDAEGNRINIYVQTMHQEEFSPSGRTVNTWITDFSADPTFVNSSLPGTRRWESGAGAGVGPGRSGERFIEYMEGIFMGYWFYETARHENAVWGAEGQFNYNNVVNFPFGFGLSFTEFAWEVEEVNHYRRNHFDGVYTLQTGTTLYTNSVIDIMVRVTNIGNRRGQEVVQAYWYAPYIRYGIEKPYIRLAAVAKTRILEPLPEGFISYPASEELVNLRFDLYDVASYDFRDSNNNGFAGFEFDAGIHNVRLQTNARWMAHEAGSGVEFRSSISATNAIIPFTVPAGGLQYDYDITVRTYAQILNPDYIPGNEDGIERLVNCPEGRYQEITRQFARNRFTGDTAFAGAPLDGSATGTPQNFMTRADIGGTFPVALTPNRPAPVVTRPAHIQGRQPTQGNVVGNLGYNYLVFELPANHTRRPQGSTATNHQMFLPYNDNGVLTDGADIRNPNHELLMRLGANFNDPLWQELLDQIPTGSPGSTGPASLEPYAGNGTLEAIVQRGGFQTTRVPAVGKPWMLDLDGPSGLNLNMLGADAEAIATAFPVSIVLAQTWNTDLAVQKGLAVAAEARAIGVSGWYAPGANIHRSPFGGRNFEYYSESSRLSGFMAAYTVMGTNAGGLRAYIKHWAINEADQNRYMLNTFLTEQAAREIYLRSFEIAVRHGGANALMSSFNRVGTVWAGSNGALNISILREEWGFRGSIVTDFAQSSMINNSGLRGGNDIWLSGRGNGISGAPGGMSMSSDMDLYVARRAAHNVLFTVANTYYLSQVSDIELGARAPSPRAPFPMWMIWGFMPIILVLSLGLVACLFFAFKKEIFRFIRFLKAKIGGGKQPAMATAGAGADGNEGGFDAQDNSADYNNDAMQSNSGDTGDAVAEPPASDPPDEA